MVDNVRRTQYVVVEVQGALLQRLRDSGVLNALAKRVLEILMVKVVPERLSVFVPPLRDDRTSARLMFSYFFSDLAKLLQFRSDTERYFSTPFDALPREADDPSILGSGANPVLHFAYGMEPVTPVHGVRRHARKLMRADLLGARRGAGVNVAIVDQGLDCAALEHVQRWGGRLGPILTWSPDQKTLGQRVTASAPSKSHGMMIARNVLDLAPQATLWDVPIVPDSIGDPGLFASRAHTMIEELRETIAQRKRMGLQERWVVVNAWAVYDRSHEWPRGDYSQNAAVELFLQLNDAQRGSVKIKPGHPLVNAVGELVEAGADVVFCAGNCGQFSASPRCTADDRGQGRSIWGANAHPEVVTVGAISVAAGWIGYSSEGPAIWRNGSTERELEKPDLVAPSHFAEDDDPALLNSGTSAATALVAGAIAALRSEGSECRELPPAEMRQRLIKTARGDGRGWDRRIGHGIINIEPLCTTH